MEEINSADVEKMDLGKIQDTLGRLNFAAGKKAEEALKVLLEGAAKKGIMPRTALKIGDDSMEAVYAQAYNLYNQGKYKESSHIFRFLILLDMMEPRYSLGLAACMHRLKDFTNAANMYLLSAALDTTNPMPHYHAADCYLQMNAFQIAIISLEMAINACAEQPQYAVLKERASLLKKGLQDKAAELVEEQLKRADEKEKSTKKGS
jgi:type III secretion system low calcium response chaperone LcrH/SycD